MVVAILAVVAGGLIAVVGDAHGSAKHDLALHEMARLRDAILRFQADTGWLPGEGPFDLDTAEPSTPPRHLQAAVPVARVEASGVSSGDVTRWFDSAANLWQLVENPLLGTTHPLRQWSPDRKRGWRGPYVGLSGEGRVRAGFVDRRVDPALVSPGSVMATPRVPFVPAVADPHARASDAEDAGHLLWSDSTTGQPLAAQGAPYLLLLPADRAQARLVCLGRDHELDPSGAPNDDLVLYLFR